MNKIFGNWLPVAAWCSLIFYLSSIPQLQTGLGTWDLILRKAAHIVEYAILYLLSRRALANTYPEWKLVKINVIAILFSCFYAATDEYHQSFVPGRGPSPVDVGIDTIGVVSGFFAYYKLKWNHG